jgi:mannose/fructose/N-acetylgalactosamine-specific phosphotransferase system component IIB
MTMNRIKLHDHVTFPKYLDMNAYFHDEQSIEKTKERKNVEDNILIEDEDVRDARGWIARKMSIERHKLKGKVQEKQYNATSNGTLQEEENEHSIQMLKAKNLDMQNKALKLNNSS